MKNFSARPGWNRLKYRLSLKRALRQRGAARDPALFRQGLRLADEGPRGVRFETWQQDAFTAVDPAWRRLAGQQSAGGVQRAYLERPRGHSKTTDTAMQLAWILQHAPGRIDGLAAAADLEQGLLIRNAVERIARWNPDLCPDLEFRQQWVANRRTGSRLTIISSDVQSSWGQLPDFVICDELSHWEKPDLWYSLISSAAKKPDCLLVVLTNAGVGQGWQWKVREAARLGERWYFSSLEGCQAPWISAEWLEEQRRLLPESVYDRLWNNRWQMNSGGFLTLAEAEACRDERLRPREKGQPGVTYVAAIDYAEKHDYTVGVVLHREGDRLVVDRMDVVCPREEEPVPVRWVEEWMERIALHFPGTRFVVDEYQLLGTIQKYESRLSLTRFAFLGGQGNHALALNLRKMILHRELAWYPGCGQLPECDQRDDLETELASVLLKQTAGGRVRIDHISDRQHHDDRVFSLGAAALEAVKGGATGDWMEIQLPSPTGGFGWT